METIILPIVKGIGVAVFLSAISIEPFSANWWIAMLTLNALVQV